MNSIYECKKCGAHHSAANWEATTFESSGILASRYTLLVCPSCKQVGAREEIDFMATGHLERFWPYSLSRSEVLDQYPEMSKWL